MRHLIYLLILAIISCNNQQQKVDNSSTTTSNALANTKAQSKNEICWIGTLNRQTPVFIHYQLDNSLIIGEIIYLNTKDKLPIKLLGTIEEDKSYRLLEFDNTGNITGIIEGNLSAKRFNGSWISPRTKRELIMRLTFKDTLINCLDIKPDESQIFGNYHYQYGENGYNGDFDISKVGKDKIHFHILSLTNVDRGPNIAEVEKDTIEIKGNNFIYRIPGSDSCEFKTTFYKGFIYINYTKSYCESQFGLNATIDGIYLKIK